MRAHATEQTARVDRVLADCATPIEQLAFILDDLREDGQCGLVDGCTARVHGMLDDVSERLPPGLPPPCQHVRPSAFQRAHAREIESACRARALRPLSLRGAPHAQAVASLRARRPRQRSRTLAAVRAL